MYENRSSFTVVPFHFFYLSCIYLLPTENVIFYSVLVLVNEGIGISIEVSAMQVACYQEVPEVHVCTFLDLCQICYPFPENDLKNIIFLEGHLDCF